MMTVMGDALVDGLSDAGSTPARSTFENCLNLVKLGVLAVFLLLINQLEAYNIKNRNSTDRKKNL